MTTNLKPHLKYSDQIALLQHRGMHVSDVEFARAAIREYGYYKISGYFYPLRKTAPQIERGSFSRLNEFVANVHFEQIVELIKFDDKLRSLVFQGTSSFEVSLRSAVAYILGEQSASFHMNESFLHSKQTEDTFTNWKLQYEKDLRNAKNQDFVRHHIMRYEGNLPIWVAVEAMQFGTLSTLISNLRDPDKQKIAEEFGIQSRTLFLGLVENIRVLRNNCVHHNRLWNSSINRALKLRPNHLVDHKLFHLSDSPKDKIYIRLVLLSELIKNNISGSTFKSELRTHVEAFPAVPLLSPEADMGFPKNWKSLDFWKS